MKKKATSLSDYEKQKLNETLEAHSGNGSLMAAAIARQLLTSEDLNEFENKKKLEQVLISAQKPEDFISGYAKLDWQNIKNVCSTLFASGNPLAMELAPIQLWDSPQSQIYDNQTHFFSSLYSNKGIETEWLIREFFNYKGFHKFCNIRITHTLDGSKVGMEMQKNVWEVLKSKGLTGSSKIQSSAFCGTLGTRKVLDACLVHSCGTDGIEYLVNTTNWEEENACEDTAFALASLDFNDKEQLKLADTIAENFLARPINFNKDYWEGFSEFKGFKLPPQQKITVIMSVLNAVVGQKLTDSLNDLKLRAFVHYQSMPVSAQRETAQWWLENHRAKNSQQDLRMVKEMLKHSHPQVASEITQALIKSQMEHQIFSDRDSQPEFQELSNVLQAFASYKRSILDNDFLHWVVDLGENNNLGAYTKADLKFVKMWCKNPEVLEEIVTSYPEDSSHKSISSWVQASKMRIELGESSKKSEKKQKRKI